MLYTNFSLFFTTIYAIRMKKLLSLHIENLLADVTGSIGSCHWHKKVK